VIITSGVKVGKANLVVANTVVTSDTADYSIVGGTPSRILGTIDPETGNLIWLPKDVTLDPHGYQEKYLKEKGKRKELEKKYDNLEARLKQLEDKWSHSTNEK